MGAGIDWDAAPPAGYRRNAKGNLIAEANVTATDREMDQVVRKIHDFGAALSAQMWRFRLHTLEDIATFLERVRERYNARLGGRKGNVQITSFDGRLRVVLAQAEHVAVGPEIDSARALVEECLDEWTKRSNVNLQALVREAFRPDAEGNLSVAQLLRLRRVAIDDPRWREAQRAIADALRPTSRSEYVRLYARPNPAEKWLQVPLHLATVRQPPDAGGDAAAEVARRRVDAALEEARAAGVAPADLIEAMRPAWDRARRAAARARREAKATDRAEGAA